VTSTPAGVTAKPISVVDATDQTVSEAPPAYVSAQQARRAPAVEPGAAEDDGGYEVRGVRRRADQPEAATMGMGGMPMWLILVAAAGGLYFFLTKKKRR